jgi:hypothetical protein
MAPALTSCWRLSSGRGSAYMSPHLPQHVPECVMFSSAPVAFLCTRMSLDLASRVSGCSAPERAILALLSSCVARFVMQPTALHCTSTLGEFICLIRGARPPSATMATYC